MLRPVVSMVILSAVVAVAVPGLGAQSSADQVRGQVEIEALTTPTTRVFANSDGSRTMEQFAVPVRARKDGKWTAVDTTLRYTDDGVVAPVASAVPMTFSAGGTGSLVRLSDMGKHVQLTWPKPLPRPRLAGDTAVYPDVLPGVDLRMRAHPQGYSQVFVVKDRTADVGQLDLALDTSGLTVRQKPDRSVVAVDSTGEEVFRAAPPAMWDSRPQDGKRTLANLDLTGTRLAIKPDAAFLRDPGTRYPVHIDPDFHAGRSAWTKVFEQFRDTSYWNGANDSDQVAKVGYSEWERPIVKARTYFQFDVTPLFGKKIKSAEFNALQVWASTCTPHLVRLNETGAIHPGTTWANQPWIGQELATQNVSAGRGSDCPAKWVGFSAHGAVVNSVNTKTPTTTVMLNAVNEADTMAWKKFDINVSLIVSYNTPPTTPTAMTAHGKACGIHPDQPYITTASPVLKATSADPDGGNVHTQFEWYIRNGARKGETLTPPQTTGTQFSTTVPAGAYKHGDTIAWRARSWDGEDWSDWSGWCDTTVDQVRPDKAPAITSADYPRNNIGGGIGRTGSFKLAPNGVGDVGGYLYDLHDQPDRYVAANSDGTATVLITPPSDTWYHLHVKSVDKAGNVSDNSVYLRAAGNRSRDAV